MQYMTELLFIMFRVFFFFVARSASFEVGSAELRLIPLIPLGWGRWGRSGSSIPGFGVILLS